MGTNVCKLCSMDISVDKNYHNKGMTFSVLDDPLMKEISNKIGCTVGQLCIAWALRKGVAVATKVLIDLETFYESLTVLLGS